MLHKISKNKKCAPRLIFFYKYFFYKDSDDFWRWKLTLKIRFWHFLTAIFGHLTSLMKKSNAFLWSVQSYLQSEMFLSNSVDVMKNLLTPYPSVLDFWKTKFKKSSSKLIFAGYTCCKNLVRNRLKIQFFKLAFSNLLFQKIKYRLIGLQVLPAFLPAFT